MLNEKPPQLLPSKRGAYKAQSRLESFPLFTLQVFQTFINNKVPGAECHQSSTVLNSRSRSVSGTLAGIPETSINLSSTNDSYIHFDILGTMKRLSDINIQQSTRSSGPFPHLELFPRPSASWQLSKSLSTDPDWRNPPSRMACPGQGLNNSGPNMTDQLKGSLH